MANRKLWLSIVTRVVVCTALIGSAMGVVGALIVSAPTPEEVEHAVTPMRVLVTMTEPVPVEREWQGFGTAAAVHAADVPARVTAVVVERPDSIRPGRAVNEGDLLVQLDSSDFERQVEMASQAMEDIEAQITRLEIERRSWADRIQIIEEEVALAQSELARTVRAMENDAAKQREVDLTRQAVLAIERTLIAAREELEKIPLRRSSLEALKAREQSALALARSNVERCRITAPIGGVLAAVDVDQGESVTAGQRVARIVDLSRLEIPLLLPSAARSGIRIGDSVVLAGEVGNPPPRWLAEISRIAPDDDPLTRTMRVFAEVVQDASSSNVLAPGMFVQGTVTGSLDRPQRLRSVVPRRAISGQRIMLASDGVIQSMPVTVDFHLYGKREASGLPDTQWAVLAETLPSGTLVVIDGSRVIPDGAAVEPVRVRDVYADATAEPQRAPESTSPSSVTEAGVPPPRGSP